MRRQPSAGFSLISLALFLMVIGVSLSTLTLLWPNLESVGREKSVAALRADRNALLGFVAAQARLPDAGELATLLPRPLDGFLNPIQYAHDAALTTPNAICAVTTTRLAVEERGNIAFALWSHGRNGRVNQIEGEPDKRPGAVKVATRLANPPFDTGGTPDDITDDLDDLLEFASLDALRAVAGCLERADGEGLSVVVDRLPAGFEERAYGSVTFSAQGGTPPHRWCVESRALASGGALRAKLRFDPDGVIPDGDGCDGPWASAPGSTLTLRGGAPFVPGDGAAWGRRHPLRIHLEDGVGQRTQRLFELVVLSLETPGAVKLNVTPPLAKPPAPPP
ncbi:MAG: hypothetical protein HQL97_16510, partial [Magnetococcales bacterium]|nr:hypothetical protein [Magnetococcales bacterium]